MPDLPPRSAERRLLRSVGMVLAIALGAVAVFLLVVSDNPKQLKFGALIGAWSAIVGAIAMFGPRRAPEVDEPLTAGREVELRRSFQLELDREVAGRREYELQLEVMLRREMEKVLRQELSQLRNEVAGLRSDLVEKVNGQLKLERIETTRLIGSDLEALQHEVRRLAGVRDAVEPAPFVRPAVVDLPSVASAPAPPAGISAQQGPVQQGPVQPTRTQPYLQQPPVQQPPVQQPQAHQPTRTQPYLQQPPVQQPPVQQPPVQQPPAQQPPLRRPAQPVQPIPVAQPIRVAQPAQPAPPAPPAPPAQPAPSEPVGTLPTVPAAAESRPPLDAADPFAGLPRLGRFVDVDDGIDGDLDDGIHHDTETGGEPRYVGRRRTSGGDPAPSDAPAEAIGRRHRPEQADTPEPTPPSGGRRRRADDEPNEVLARLLGR